MHKKRATFRAKMEAKEQLKSRRRVVVAKHDDDNDDMTMPCCNCHYSQRALQKIRKQNNRQT